MATAVSEALVGREWLLADVRQWWAEGTAPLYEIVGGPGVGKTAVVGALAEELTNSVLCCFLRDRRRGRLDDCSATQLYRRLAEALANKYPEVVADLAAINGVHVDQVVHVNSGAVIGVLLDSSALNDARRLKEQVVLPLLERMDQDALVIVDGLDEISETERWRTDGMRLMPEIEQLVLSAIPRLKVLVASRPASPLVVPRELRRRASLDSDWDGSSEFDTAPPPDVNDVATYAARQLGDRFSTADADAVSRAAAGNFLFARYLVDALIEGHTIESATHVPEGLDDWYRLEWRRLRERWENPGSWSDVERALGVLAAARGSGLSGRQVRQITGLTDRDTQRLARDCRHYLSGSLGQALRIYHQSFADFLFLGEGLSTVESNLSIAQYFVRNLDEWSDEDRIYAGEHVFAHLRAAALDGVPDDVRTSREVATQLLRHWAYLEARMDLAGPDGLSEDLDGFGRMQTPGATDDPELTKLLAVLTTELPRISGALATSLGLVQQLHTRAAISGDAALAHSALARLRERRATHLEVAHVVRSTGVQSRDRSVSIFPLHNGGVRSLDWHDGHYATAGDDGVVTIRSEDRHTAVATLFGHRAGVRNVRWRPGGEQLASAGDDGDVRIWTTTGPVHTHCAHRTLCWALAWSPDGKLLASGDDLGEVRIWKKPGQSDDCSLGHHHTKVRAVAWEPNASVLLSADRDGIVRRWAAPTMDLLEVRQLHNGSIRSMTVNAEGHVLTAGRDDSVRCWSADLRSEEWCRTRPGVGARSASWSAQSDLVAVAWWDGLVEVLNSEGERLTQLAGSGDWIRSVAWRQGTLLIGSHDGEVLTWVPDESSHARRHAARLRGVRVLPGDPMSVVLHTGHLAGAGATAKPEMTPGVDRVNGEVLRAAAYGLGESSQLLATATSRPDVVLRSRSTNEEVRTLTGLTDWIRAVAFAPSGILVAAGSDDRDIVVWTVADGSEQMRMAAHDRGVRCLAWSPDGQLLASGGADGVVRIWSMNTAQELGRSNLQAGEVLGLAWTASGSLIACGTASGVVEVLTAQGCAVAATRLPAGVNDILTQPDGEIACAVDDPPGVLLSLIGYESLESPSDRSRSGDL